MDLDIVVLQNFDDEIVEMTKSTEQMCCVSDAIRWMGEKVSPSLMCFESSSLSYIFNNFVKTESIINNLEGSSSTPNTYTELLLAY